MKKISNISRSMDENTRELRRMEQELLECRKTLDATREMRETERRHYQDLFDNAPDPSLVTDSDCLILEANRASMNLLGETNLNGKSLSQFIDGEQRPAFFSALVEVLFESGPVSLDFRLCPKNRNPFEAALTASLKSMIDGDSPRILWSIHDASNSRQMESNLLQLNDQLESTVETRTQELRQAVDRLKNEIARREGAETELHKRSKMLEGFFELTATPLAFLDASFKLLRVNKAFSQATGIDPNHLSGRNYFECFPDCRAEPLFKKVIRTETAHREFAKPYIFPGSPQRGTTYWNWTLAPLINNKEKIEWLVLNLEDVTEREKAIYELNRRTKQLQKLTLELSAAEDRERNRLSEILHDDLQQILVAAKFNIAMLQNHPQDAANRIIAAEVEHMISDAIQKSRSLSHELSPTILHRNDFSEIMRWLVDQVYTTQGLEVRIEVKSKVLVQSDSLRAFLYKSVQELLFNVVKHARVHHAVLKIRKISRYICISVIDQGRGFDPASLNESEGFGIFGIRERAELLGGRMRIKSAKGAGSNLTLIVPDLELPIVNRPLETHYMDPATREQNRLRILIADDHEIVREGLASLLSEQKDMEVVAQAGNGREAVHLAGELRPDVVVMDASMPLMNGDEATRQIKAYLPQTRVVVLSMFEQEEMVQRMYRAGVQGYVLKTAPPDELLAAIRSTAA